MYGAIMAITGQIEVAELFFDVLTRLYPLFTEGWVAFSMFYNIIGKKEGVDVTLGVANKCEILLEHPKQNLSKFPPINWNVNFHQFSEEMLIRAAIYMLSLNLHKNLELQFVEACMGQVLAEKKCETSSYHYYLAACHYQQKRYSDSLKHLEAIKTLKWADSNLWCLMGNNYYSMKKHKLAKRAYTMAVETSKIGNTCLSTLLSFVRMGFYQLGEHKYEEAYFIFKSIVSQYPTAKTWCGLGIACYRLNHHSDAELALTESNMLDAQCSLTWAYLALINGIRKNANNFEQCARIAIEKGLRASELVKELWNVWQHLIGVTRRRSKLKILSESEINY
uniref:Uncharacterized protein n=1 Tax=Rhodnius prolixus TaxID=13249 RepID=T1HG29_RHOPR